ncbi:MAG: alpha/beta hydrolase [Reyranella sp.]|uniref:lipase family alpha/beta hydrolase n=1 Tax=Reyranella sp. TaxID=1929291 RepID=UPI001AC82C94|nr:alpha/beta hydrolase [Reyranella sp.]MBN9087621.1 alpha/beta hydrolase [Reyranella sp.]
MAHAIIVLPGTTGTSLVANQADETSQTPVWEYWAVREGAVLPSTGADALEKALYAGRPGGYGKKDKKTGLPKGYPSLIDSIVTAAQNAKATYVPMYTTWPTNTPPISPPQQQQPWLQWPLTANAVIGWGYDWRQDNLTVTALMLQNFLYSLVSSSPAVDKITLIGHSMGGLVSRTYLEHVGVNDTTIMPKIDQLITLGTPHLGAPLALGPISHTLDINLSGQGSGNAFIALLHDVLDVLEQPAVDNVIKMVDMVVNSNPMGISTYQLLPPGFTPFISSDGTDYSIFANNLPAGLVGLLKDAGMLQTNLTCAGNLFNVLNYTGTPANIAYNCLYGIVGTGNTAYDPSLAGQIYTTTGYSYTPGAMGGPLQPVETDNGGDLVVPKVSAMFTGNSSVTTYEVPGADHISMPSNPAIQTKVNALLNFAS